MAIVSNLIYSKMNKKNMTKKNKKPPGEKLKNHHGKSQKNGFKHNKKKKLKLGNGNSNSTQLNYTPEAKGPPPIEIQFAKKLASNEPTIRDKAVKKLRKWLIARSCGGEEVKQAFNDSEMLRLWKGLHYCFWMSDKPLVQEELAEKIASIIHCFKADEKSGQLYIKCFFMTLGREWIGIDKHRMDKFMMLTRRMIRQTFAYVAENNWQPTTTTNFAQMFQDVVLGANRVQNADAMALGFQLHFTDIYLEELAKSTKLASELPSKQSFTDDTIETLLSPFVNELAWGSEERLLSHIENRIFDHLIRQSDVAIEYEEDNDEDDINDQIGNSEDKTLKDHNKNDENEEDIFHETDPRAGRGDVILPQIQLDYGKVAKKLLEAGSNKEVAKPQRNRLYRITKKFNNVASGIYPFALEMSEDGERLISKKEFEEEERNLKIKVKEAARKKLNENLENSLRTQDERKAFKLAMKKRIQAEKNENSVKQPLHAKGSESESNTDSNIKTEDKDGSKTVKEKKRKKKIKMKNKNETNENSVKQPLHCKGSETNTDSNNKTEDIDGSKTVKEKKRKKKNKMKNKNETNNIANDKSLKKVVSKVSEISPKDHKKDDIDKSKNTEVQDTPAKPLKGKRKHTKGDFSGEPTKKVKMQENDMHDTSSQSIVLETSKKTKKKSRKEGKNKQIENVPTSTNDHKLGASGINERKSDGHMGNLETMVINEFSAKNRNTETLFKENEDWDEPLEDGESEIVIPNPKYNGQVKLLPSVHKKKKGKKSKEEHEVYSTPSIQTPKKMPTPVYIKKAISKSGTEKSVNSIFAEKRIHSEPKRHAKTKNTGKMKATSKKINFAMSENKCQSLRDLDISIQQSPHFQPYDATKKPAKGPILKTPPLNNKSSENSTPLSIKKKKQAVLYNTMVNGKSKFVQRAVASDFF